MTQSDKDMNIQHLKPDCSACFGLCCVALYFSKQDGFPADKSAGTPCEQLNRQFRCAVHERLGALGLKGCRAYECFGAGQQVSQVTFHGVSWRQQPEKAEVMFKAFLIMRQLYESCWYLNEALSFHAAAPVLKELQEALSQSEAAANLPLQDLLRFDLDGYHQHISGLLRKVSLLVRTEKSRTMKIKLAPQSNGAPKDYLGKDLRKQNLRCACLRGSCLIAANLQGADLTGTDLLGADMRDADIRGANLSESLFLTQFQVNTARGDGNTKLPPSLSHPKHWA
ncbi:pentapeptide repeat-containing protein [Acetanaerobacterium elongatum]|uniref:Uncharacterized protein YjbI, contains pentapeptide repeats n=1 Tax=Acetanaerobacterium elongatum TaxID=258515 RepID=A0A1G9U4X8_9FIRM|nr:pentapeptide repeat-containing protein [Acetanaerobacterium elongatum]SDM55027.1 Uncharacterized protein YjbI, contains pentapeptide repeats [Acetanaerobacterium elongatum]